MFSGFWDNHYVFSNFKMANIQFQFQKSISKVNFKNQFQFQKSISEINFKNQFQESISISKINIKNQYQASLAISKGNRNFEHDCSFDIMTFKLSTYLPNQVYHFSGNNNHFFRCVSVELFDGSFVFHDDFFDLCWR